MLSAARARSAAVSLAGLFVLAACAPQWAAEGGPEPMNTPPPLRTTLATAPVTEPRMEARPSVPPPPVRPAALAPRRPPPPAPPRRPAFPRVAPGALADLSAERALALFGQPVSARNSGGLRVWTYEHDACRLTLRFQFSVLANEMRVLDHAIDSGRHGRVPAAICLHVLARDVTTQAVQNGGEGMS